ncbi:MAG: hypothetical protein GY913_13095 [Proteobacteria bacterium]|nr:hypothetical protein [Pseudomonadota bacterium]MCP4917843.1 hypothetical protein [Pseudomonadota bacterium]
MLKLRGVDEFYAAPVSVGISLMGRTGEAYADQRHRLTALGDGQTALGGAVSVGRTASLATGWYSTSATGGYWHRLALGDARLPGELAYSANFTWSPDGRFGLGPMVYGFHRLGGSDLNKINWDDPNAWAVCGRSRPRSAVGCPSTHATRRCTSRG